MSTTEIVSLWLNNEESTYNDCVALAEEHADSRYALADAIEVYVRGLADSIAPDVGGTFVGDILGHALSGVDWRELADDFSEAVTS